MPTKITTAPMIENIIVQLDDSSRLKNINPPKTTKIATSGIMELIPSTEPLLVESVLSVIQALKAASFAVEPKNVIMQSNAIVSVTPNAAAEVTIGKSVPSTCVFSNAKQKMEMPHNI